MALLSTNFTVSCVPAAKGNKHDYVRNRLPLANAFFVHGDPKELYKGTVQDKSGLGTFARASDLDHYTITGFAQFKQVVAKDSVQKISSQDELEERNSTNASEGEHQGFSDYSFVADGKALLLKDSSQGHEDYPVLTFVAEKGNLVLALVDNFNATPVHYSIKENGEAFSLLYSTEDDHGIALNALYFTKIKPVSRMVRILNLPQNYFLLGDGKAVNWRRDISVDVCGSTKLEYKTLVEDSLENWSIAGGFKPGFIGDNRYTVNVKPKAKPFTDLNQNCVNFIENYKNEDQDDLVNMGVTLPMIDEFSQEIYNAQIFIFLNATKRSGMPIGSVLTHEMGHLLGLGHEFKKNAHDVVFPSIMGYEGVIAITDADRKAIRSLYSK